MSTFRLTQNVAGEPGYLPEDDLDETLHERIAGLGEMFPDPIRNGISSVCNVTGRVVKSTYSFTRTYAWIFFSSAAVLFAPVLVQSGLQDFEEMAKAQQQQLLLGTNPSAYPR